ncbi:metal ABC transporter permease [Thioalkalicoccus limnaeus]|uniref:Metal ABC transporter permease n=1 Tax=Thioalkalicoccus limnaeus TaxID=120681 RepID=A0ABV4BL99_9GAMM
MTITQIEIQLVAIVVAAACALPGVYLVLRGMAMMSDAISHAILPGIVIAFLIVGNLNSPLLIVGAALMGLITVVLVEVLTRSGLVREDTAIGLVFPALFSIGVILIARYAGDIHLDLDAVLLGELAFAPFNRLEIAGVDLGPQGLYAMGAIGLMNLVFILLFYKELKLATFDAALASTLGFAPVALHYLLMGLVSLTAVAAFDAVGAILVVALIVGPPAAARLLTDRLGTTLVLSVALGVACAISGYWLAHWLDASIAGSMATMVGVCFTAAFLFAPVHGYVAQQRSRRKQRWSFARRALLIHLLQHERLPEAEWECHADHLQDHFSWDLSFAESVINQAIERDSITLEDGRLRLTSGGRSLAEKLLGDH